MAGVSRSLLVSYFTTANELLCCLFVLTPRLFLGIDVYLRLPRLGTNLESIEI